jgi:hypothetical protein
MDSFLNNNKTKNHHSLQVQFSKRPFFGLAISQNKKCTPSQKKNLVFYGVHFLVLPTHKPKKKIFEKKNFIFSTSKWISFLWKVFL